MGEYLHSALQYRHSVGGVGKWNTVAEFSHWKDYGLSAWVSEHGKRVSENTWCMSKVTGICYIPGWPSSSDDSHNGGAHAITTDIPIGHPTEGISGGPAFKALEAVYHVLLPNWKLRVLWWLTCLALLMACDPPRPLDAFEVIPEECREEKPCNGFEVGSVFEPQGECGVALSDALRLGIDTESDCEDCPGSIGCVAWVEGDAITVWTPGGRVADGSEFSLNTNRCECDDRTALATQIANWEE